MDVSYEISLGEDFQGPLEDLLSAARSQDVPLQDLDLTALIRDFAEHLSMRLEEPVSRVSEYLLIFSELIRIKTRILLPHEEEEDTEEESEIEESPQGFFEEAAQRLKERAGKRAKLLENESEDVPSEIKQGETSFREVTLFELIRSFQKVMATVREDPSPDIELTNEFNTEEQMKYIMERVRSGSLISFEDLLRSEPTREEIIVTFLSILQLVKQDDLRLVRRENDGTIRIVQPD